MNISTLFSTVSERTTSIRARAASFAPLLARLTTGVVFLQSGFGKVQHLDKVTAFFTDLGLPAPAFQAHLVASTELVGGALMLVGLATRFSAVPLAITMVVALLTAKRADIGGVGDLFGTVEWTYLAMLVGLALTGAGRASLDAWIAKRVKRPALATTSARMLRAMKTSSVRAA